MQLMSAMANGFNMNAPLPQPVRMSCGELRAHHAGMTVELTGRLIKKRVNRFVVLRDRNGGATQMVVLEEKVQNSLGFSIPLCLTETDILHTVSQDSPADTEHARAHGIDGGGFGHQETATLLESNHAHRRD